MREAIQYTGSVLHEHPSETSGGSRDVTDDVSSEAPPISGPCCIIDSERNVSFGSRNFEDELIMVGLC